jgi:arginase
MNLDKAGPAMKQTIALIGVPSSAGAHWPGQEKAPRVLRRAGLVTYLEAAGLEVIDYGDLPRVRFRPDRVQRHQQNLAAVIGVARQVAGQIDLALQGNAIPLVIGGDCTISLGVIAGFLHHDQDLSLLYFDGHVDLNTPATSPSGILDSMGLAHLIGEPGTAAELSHIGPRFPLLPEDKIVLFGYNPGEINAPEQVILAQRRWLHYPLSEVQSRAAQAALEALTYLEQQARRFVVHFDVDVIDFTDFPIADVPQFSQGLMFREALACLAVFASSPNFCGLTVTEFNPDHADEENVLAATFNKGLAQVLAGQASAMT